MAIEPHLPKTRSEWVYALIKEKILGGEYQPGQRVVADQLVRELNTSVIPIREALNRLESEGLVEMQPYVGARVALISESDVEELLEMRMALEPVLARSCAEHGTPEAIAELETLCDDMAAALGEANFIEYSRKNYQFHDRIYQLSPWRTLYQTVASIRDKFARSRWVFHLAPNQSRDSQAEHREMVTALRNRDGEALQRLTRQQKERALHLFRRVVRERMKGI